MPYKDANAQRLYQRQLMRERRAAARESRAVVESADSWPDDPAGAVAQWSREVLRVPFGHPRAGEAMTLPPYLVDFLRDALTHSESALLIGRKNAKSAAWRSTCWRGSWARSARRATGAVCARFRGRKRASSGSNARTLRRHPASWG